MVWYRNTSLDALRYHTIHPGEGAARAGGHAGARKALAEIRQGRKSSFELISSS